MDKVNSSDFYRWGLIAAENNKIENAVSGEIFSEDINSYTKTPLQTADAMPGRVIRIVKRTYERDFFIDGSRLNLYTFMYVYSGKLKVDCGNFSKTINGGVLIAIPSDANYAISQISERVSVFMLFCAGSMVDCYGKILNNSNIKYFCEGLQGEFFKVTEKINFLISETDVYSNVRISDALSKIFTYLIGIPELNQTILAKERNFVFIKHVQYITSHLGEKLTIKKLAEIAQMSVASYHRFVKNNTGESPYAFITKLRLDKARELIISTKLQIKTVAITVGIPSLNHFSNRFEKQFKILPSKLRETLE